MWPVSSGRGCAIERAFVKRQVVFACGLLALVSSAAAAEDRPEKASAYWSHGAYLVLAPDAAAEAAVPTRTYRENDLMMSAPIAYRHVATLKADATVEVGGLRFDLKKGRELPEALVSGGRTADLGERALVFCAESETDTNKVLASSLTLGLSSIGNRYGSSTMLCSADREQDGRLDVLFLLGTRDSADRELAAVDIPYSRAANVQVGDMRLEMRFSAGRAMFDPGITAMVKQGDAALPVQLISFVHPLEASVQTSVRPYVRFRSQPMPKKLELGPANFVVHKKYKDAADIEVVNGLKPSPIQWQLAPKTMYIYVPG